MGAFRADGTFVESVGERGSGPGQLLGPSGVTLTPQRQLYVADHGNRRVLHFDWQHSPARFVRTLGSGALVGPSDVVVDSTGFIYVVDWVGGEIVKLHDDGREVLRWRGSGGEPQQPPILFAAVVDGTTLHLTDMINGRVQTYERSGNLLQECVRRER
ncbi:MAG: hypothetical protein JSW67_12375 [Candidatus Latescibacterota bacterium]|nr:MAG: hypothetical protein JSW67_12375 [Candidatus Latescibacterota bacterium]